MKAAVIVLGAVLGTIAELHACQRSRSYEVKSEFPSGRTVRSTVDFTRR